MIVIDVNYYKPAMILEKYVIEMFSEFSHRLTIILRYGFVHAIQARNCTYLFVLFSYATLLITTYVRHLFAFENYKEVTSRIVCFFITKFSCL